MSGAATCWLWSSEEVLPGLDLGEAQGEVTAQGSSCMRAVLSLPEVRSCSATCTAVKSRLYNRAKGPQGKNINWVRELTEEHSGLLFVLDL